MSDAAPTGGIAAGRPPRPEEAEAVFQAMEERLDAIAKSPVVARDAVAQRILAEMARTPEMENVVALLDQLNARITELRQRRGNAAPIPSETNERARRHVLRL